jgi:hypothetical protein
LRAKTFQVYRGLTFQVETSPSFATGGVLDQFFSVDAPGSGLNTGTSRQNAR